MLNPAQLKADILALMVNAPDGMTPEAAMDRFAEGMARAVDAYVRAANVVVNMGIPVQVSPSGTGTTVGPGTGTLT